MHTHPTLAGAATLVALHLIVAAGGAHALDNGVGLTPAMGYNTWDDFRCGGINSTNVAKVADAIVHYGLDKVGYQYLGLDDCWATSRDKDTGVIVPNPKAFPQGMKSVADYVHSKGLKFGIYTDRGTATCVGRPGSQGHETIDAQTYAKWGVDLVKEDSCSAPTDHASAFKQYALMRDALNATGRPIYFALCGWSSWYAPVGKTLGNSWRYGYDVNDWNSAYSNSIAASSALAADAGPGGWNDPDALIGTSTSTAVHMTQKQSRTQMSLWAMMAAPLSIGSNILNMNVFDLETYKNVEVIAVDQDVAGLQGGVFAQSATCNMRGVGTAIDSWTGTTARQRRKRLQAVEDGESRSANASSQLRSTGTCTALPDCQQTWTRNLSNGDVALAFVNYTQVIQDSAGSGLARSGHAWGSGARMSLAPCDASLAEQLWKLTATTASGGMTAVQSMAGSKSCWEVNGCGFRPGGGVDTGYGCKPLPAKGVTDPCCSNMAWVVQDKASTITSVWNASLCFQLRKGGGGEIEACDGSAAQKWTLRKATAAPGGNSISADGNGLAPAAGEEYQIVAASGQCLANTVATVRAHTEDLVERAHEPPQRADEGLSFDVAASLGWAKGAKVRNLWTKEELGVLTKVTARLSGDGDSAMFRLSKVA